MLETILCPRRRVEHSGLCGAPLGWDRSIYSCSVHPLSPHNPLYNPIYTASKVGLYIIQANFRCNSMTWSAGISYIALNDSGWLQPIAYMHVCFGVVVDATKI